MKVIIDHDDYCSQSPRGKDRWLSAFEKMRAKSARGFDTLTTMQAHVEEWAELARAPNSCSCGAAEEIERREHENQESMVAIGPQA